MVVIFKIIIARSNYSSTGIAEQYLAWPALCNPLEGSTAARKDEKDSKHLFQK